MFPYLFSSSNSQISRFASSNLILDKQIDHFVLKQHLNADKSLRAYSHKKIMENFFNQTELDTLVAFKLSKSIRGICIHCALCYTLLLSCTFAETLLNFVPHKNFFVQKKAAEVLNCCIIGKILHNFLMPIRIEPAPITFVCIQMLLQRRVR